jgi:diguanylate cyclase (GGDEF)-like protein/PAS domain S-box-containing protein
MVYAYLGASGKGTEVSVVHALLQRQLEKILGREVPADAPVAGLVDEAQLAQLLERVSATYRAYDAGRRVLEPDGVEAALRASEERYALALRGANDGIWDWELPGRHVHVSARGAEMLGLPLRDGLMPLARFYRRIHADDREVVRRRLSAHLEDEHALLEIEFRMRHADGDWRWILLRGAAVRDGDGRARRIAGSLSDVTPRKQAETELVRASLHDRLTGLPNRGYFLDAVQRVLARTRRRPEVRFAVAFVDLDRLKLVNDTLGHQAGDRLLSEFAQRISGVVRAGDMVARLAGDEFALLLDELSTPADALQVAERVNGALERPMDVHGHSIVASASIGVVMSDPAYESAEQMLRDADIAMYRAKARGRRGYALFDREMHERAHERLQLEADLSRALARSELRVHYQPIVRLGGLEPVGCEALARWFHPTRGLISPAEWIPIAEESGEMRALGRWVLGQACHDARALGALGDTPLYVSVNLSASQLLEDDLVAFIEGQLADAAILPEQLCLEITESALLDPPPAAVATLAHLRALGVLVHLDDFGTGHASLTYLHKMEVDSIKIDRSFVTRGGGDSDAMLSSIVLLAQRLGKLSVAEGIESESELALCRRLGCALGQGYLFARPMDLEATSAWLRVAHRSQRKRRKPDQPTPRARG